jgi:hypothetical protein
VRPLLFEIHVTRKGARYPKIKPHTSHRYNRIVVFNHCVIFPIQCMSPVLLKHNLCLTAGVRPWSTSVQEFSENYLSLCRQRISYQTGYHNLHHNYIIDIHFFKSLGRSLAQEVSRKRRISLEYMTLRFVVDKLTMGHVSSEYIAFHLSASLHECSMFILHLSPKLNNFSNSKRCAAFEFLPHCYVSLPVVVFVAAAFNVNIVVFVLILFFKF